MKFERFPSLVNENPKNVEKLMTDPKLANAQCYVTEKIHGANFGIWWDVEEGVRFSKRSSFLGDETNFYNWRRFFTDDRIAAIEKRCQSMHYHIGVTSIEINGELFGGGGVPNVKAVQHQIKYDDDIQFLAFRIKIDGEILGLEKMRSIIPTFGLGVVPVIAAGNFQELYTDLNPDKPTKVGTSGHIREGLVYVVDRFDSDGNPLMVKKRSKNYLETKAIPKQKGNNFSDEDLPEIQNAMAIYKAMCTPQRVSNVNSHHGYDNLKDFTNLLLLVVEDIHKDYKEAYGELGDVALRVCKKLMGRTLPPMIRTELTK